MTDMELMTMDAFFQPLLLAIIQSTLIMLVTKLLDRFGWRAQLRDDVEVYKNLVTLSEEKRTTEEELVLAMIRNRSFEVASRQIRGNSLPARVVSISLTLLLLCVPACIIAIPVKAVAPDFYTSYMPWIIRFCTAFAAISTVSIIWSAKESNKERDYRKMKKGQTMLIRR